MKIAVIYDAFSDPSANEPLLPFSKDQIVPLREIKEALECSGHGVEVVPVSRDVGRFVDDLRHLRPDVVFNLCEAIDGEAVCEMHVAAILDLLRLAYTGSGPVALAISLDKARAKDLLRARGIDSPRHRLLRPGEGIDESELRYPLIVKPAREDASVGIEFDGVVKDRRSLETRVAHTASRFGGTALVEEYVDGRELNVAILVDDRGPELLPISEIDFSRYPKEWPKILSFDAKWSLDSEAFRSSVPICPAPLPPEIEARVLKASLLAFETLGCSGYARVDLRLDAHGVVFVIEVNPNPDISPDAGFARAARVAGMSYPTLLDRIVHAALRFDRYEQRRADPARAVG